MDSFSDFSNQPLYESGRSSLDPRNVPEIWRNALQYLVVRHPENLPPGLGADRYPRGSCSIDRRSFRPSISLVCRAMKVLVEIVFRDESEWTFFAKPDTLFVASAFTRSSLQYQLPLMKQVCIRLDFFGCICHQECRFDEEKVSSMRDNVIEICKVLRKATKIRMLTLKWEGRGDIFNMRLLSSDAWHAFA